MSQSNLISLTVIRIIVSTFKTPNGYIIYFVTGTAHRAGGSLARDHSLAPMMTSKEGRIKQPFSKVKIFVTILI